MTMLHNGILICRLLLQLLASELSFLSCETRFQTAASSLCIWYVFNEEYLLMINLPNICERPRKNPASCIIAYIDHIILLN